MGTGRGRGPGLRVRRAHSPGDRMGVLHVPRVGPSSAPRPPGATPEGGAARAGPGPAGRRSQGRRRRPARRAPVSAPEARPRRRRTTGGRRDREDPSLRPQGSAPPAAPQALRAPAIPTRGREGARRGETPCGANSARPQFPSPARPRRRPTRGPAARPRDDACARDNARGGAPESGTEGALARRTWRGGATAVAGCARLGRGKGRGGRRGAAVDARREVLRAAGAGSADLGAGRKERAPTGT